MFEVGDMVVYGAQGLCRVEQVGPLPMKFADKSKQYYTLRACKSPGMTIYAPVDNPTVVMRAPLTREQAEALIEAIPGIETTHIADNKEREVHYRAALHGCDCRELLRLLKSLHGRHLARVKSGKRDMAIDEKYFRLAQEQLYSELSYALNIAPDAVEDYIASRVASVA